MRAAHRLAILAHCRAVLARVTAGLTVEELDHRQFPDAKSNGEILLHIAGFEFLMVACAKLARGDGLDAALWPALKPGFAREAGFAPPQQRSLHQYFQLLDAVRERTADFLGRGDDTDRIEAASFAIFRVAQHLAEADPGEGMEHYRRLAAGVSTSFADDGSPDAAGMVDLPALLALHETYHRGQITLNKYTCSRLLRGDARR
jgi:hypothetical protein